MTHEKTISDLAYHLWNARGRPEGSAEVDWAEAERQVRGGASASANRALEAPVPAPDTPRTAGAEGAAATRSDSASTADGGAAPDSATPAVPRARKKAKQ